MAISITEIAKLANVSIGTVDRVIHNRKGVSSSTAAKIRKIIEETNFTPNVNAQAIQKLNKKISIAFVTHRYTASIYYSTFDGIKAAVRYIESIGYHCTFIYVEETTIQTYCRVLDSLVDSDYNVVFTLPQVSDKVDELIARLIEKGKKVICLNRFQPNAYNVTSLPNPEFTGKLLGETLNLLHRSNEKIIYVNDELTYFGVNFKDKIVEGFKNTVNPDIEVTFINSNDEFYVYTKVCQMLQEEHYAGMIAMAPTTLKALIHAKQMTKSDALIYTNDNSNYVRDCLKNRQIDCAILFNAFNFAYVTILKCFKSVFPEVQIDEQLYSSDAHINLPINMK